MNREKVNEAIANIEKFRGMLEDAAKDLVGNVDDGTMAVYSSLVRKFDTFTDMLKAEMGTLGKEPEFNNAQLEDFHKESALSTRAYNALHRAGINTLKDLTYVSMSDLKDMRMMGRNTIEEVEWFCKERGFELGSDRNNIPEYHIGDEAVTLYDKRTLDAYERPVRSGTRVVIEGPRNVYSYGYHLKCYTCKVTEGNAKGSEISLSPGEMEAYLGGNKNE